jgi:type II secretory pathway component PulJ
MSQLLRPVRGIALIELVITIALLGIVAAGVGGAWVKAQEAFFASYESAELQQNVRAALDFMAREIRSAGLDATTCAFDYATTATTDCDGAKVAHCASKLAATGPPAWEVPNGLGGAGCTRLHTIPVEEATASTLRIRADRNHNGRIGGRGNAVTAPSSAADHGEEDVLYALSTTSCPPGVPRCITRDDGTGPTALVAVNVEGLTFTYYPRSGFGPCAGVAAPCDLAFPLPLASQADADNLGRIRITVEARGQVGGQTVTRTMMTAVTLRNRS